MARLMIAAAIILFPLSLARVDQRGAALSKLVLQLERTSPAFAAFEDLQNNYLPTEETFESASVHETLRSGQPYTPSLEQPLDQKPAVVLALKPLTIKREMDPMAHLPQWENTEELPSLRQRKQMLTAELSSEVLRQPSVGEKAKELVQRELSSLNVRSDVKEIPTSSGGTIIVRKEGAFAQTVTSPYSAYSTGNDSGFSPASPNHDGILISGPVQLRDGVGDLGIHSNWRIFREVNGLPVERGSINIRQAEFSIRVGEKTGYVVAELSDHFGKVLGRGRVSLEGNDSALYVAPVASVTVAAYSPTLVESAGATSLAAKYKPFGQTVIEASGGESLEMSQYTANSRFLMEASSRGHYPTVVLGSLSALSRIPLYTESAVRAFRSIVKSFYKAIDIEYSGLVWGRITKDGVPVSGASVEVAEDLGKLIYFNEIGIPRSDLVGTTSYGQFAVTNLPEGVQSVRVIHDGHVYPAQIVPSVRGRLSQLNLEIPTRYISQRVQSFSLLSEDEFVPSTVRIIGHEDNYDLDETTLVLMPELKEGFWLEMDSGPGYEVMRTHLPQLAAKVQINLPAVSSQWLEQMVYDAGIRMDRALGTVIGFVDGSDSEVSLPDLGGSAQQIIYFDRDKKIFNGNYAPAGGGYLVVNLPLGFQTVEVRGLHAPQSFVESVVSEANFLALIGSQGFIKPLGQEDL